jgi:hypothetical protein
MRCGISILVMLIMPVLLAGCARRPPERAGGSKVATTRADGVSANRAAELSLLHEIVRRETNRNCFGTTPAPAPAAVPAP